MQSLKSNCKLVNHSSPLNTSGKRKASTFPLCNALRHAATANTARKRPFTRSNSGCSASNGTVFRGRPHKQLSMCKRSMSWEAWPSCTLTCSPASMMSIGNVRSRNIFCRVDKVSRSLALCRSTFVTPAVRTDADPLSKHVAMSRMRWLVWSTATASSKSHQMRWKGVAGPDFFRFGSRTSSTPPESSIARKKLDSRGFSAMSKARACCRFA
mmetsp:Transcript_75620/g.211980  ORF Transcript_75620/g.211980 Transcript_75620/m.211980 type:complete len:212 (+) Transcript_75620:478-1113(+)